MFNPNRSTLAPKCSNIRRECFSVRKISGSAKPYSVDLLFCPQTKKLYYGAKLKWYLSGLSDAWLSWSGNDGTVAYEWEIVGKPAGARPAQAAREAAAKEAFPPLPNARPSALPTHQVQPGEIDEVDNPPAEDVPRRAALRGNDTWMRPAKDGGVAPSVNSSAPPLDIRTGVLAEGCLLDERKWFMEDDQNWHRYEAAEHWWLQS
eukprot:Skav217288  [mRNA]  locus=scaffold120:294955:302951:+ [translate_table: standard]